MSIFNTQINWHTLNKEKDEIGRAKTLILLLLNITNIMLILSILNYGAIILFENIFTHQEAAQTPWNFSLGGIMVSLLQGDPGSTLAFLDTWSPNTFLS